MYGQTAFIHGQQRCKGHKTNGQESQKSRKKGVVQNFGHLLEVTNDGKRTYCALGTLFCQKGQLEPQGNSDGIETCEYSLMLRDRYNVSDELLSLDAKEELDCQIYDSKSNEYFKTTSSNGITFDKLIYFNNDVGRLTFGEIADFLETTFLDGIE